MSRRPRCHIAKALQGLKPLPGLPFNGGFGLSRGGADLRCRPRRRWRPACAAQDAPPRSRRTTPSRQRERARALLTPAELWTQLSTLAHALLCAARSTSSSTSWHRRHSAESTAAGSVRGIEHTCATRKAEKPRSQRHSALASAATPCLGASECVLCVFVQRVFDRTDVSTCHTV